MKVPGEVQSASSIVSKVMFLHNGEASSTSGTFFAELANKTRDVLPGTFIQVRSSSLRDKTLWGKLQATFRLARSVAGSDALVVHSRVIVTLVYCFIAKVLGKKLVVFSWDEYPTTYCGVPARLNFVERFAGFAERVCLGFADLVVLPSEDFNRPATRANRVLYLYLWPSEPLLSKWATIEGGGNPSSGNSYADGDPIRICFVGQINFVRGLPENLLEIARKTNERIELHVFSLDRLHDISMPTNLKIVHHGFVQGTDLSRLLSGMHFGLISLNPLMQQAAFPSKVFEYVQEGLPVLYFGCTLRAYISLMESSGIGVDITNIDKVRFLELYRSSMLVRDHSIQEFLALTKLTTEKVDKLWRSIAGD